MCYPQQKIDGLRLPLANPFIFFGNSAFVMFCQYFPAPYQRAIIYMARFLKAVISLQQKKLPIKSTVS